MRFTTLAVHLIAGFTLAASAAAASDDTQALLSLEHRWLAAGVQRDTAALKKILADDFLDVTFKGTLRDKADHLKATLAPVHIQQSLDDLKVRIYGNTGIVTGVDVGTGPDGLTSYRLRFTDVFVKHAGHWQAVSAQETLEQTP